MIFKKCTTEDVDGTRAQWRPSHHPSPILGTDGLPVDFLELAVISCPGCGAPFAIGADDAKIQKDGTTDGKVHCHEAKCQWSDFVTLEGYADAVGRDHYGRDRQKHLKDVGEARLNKLRKRISARRMEEFQAMVEEELRKTLPDPLAKDANEVFRKAMGMK